MPCPISPQYPAWNQSLPYFDVQKNTIFIKIYHDTCNRLCRVTASPGGYWQPSLSLVSDELQRSFGKKTLHPRRFPRLTGLWLTCCPVLTWGRIPPKLKSPGNWSIVVVAIYFFVCQNPNGFTSNFFSCLDKILRTAGWTEIVWGTGQLLWNSSV